jgi:hypothetical protein
LISGQSTLGILALKMLKYVRSYKMMVKIIPQRRYS